MQYLLRVVWLLPVILLLILHSHSVPADELRVELPDAKQVADRSTAEDSQSQRDAIQAEKRRKVGLVGILVVLGVALIMLILIGFTMAWGRGLRRTVRKPLRKLEPEDELWYLRKREPSSEDGPGEDRADHGT